MQASFSGSQVEGVRPILTRDHEKKRQANTGTGHEQPIENAWQP